MNTLIDQERVLVLAPTTGDAALTRSILEEAGLVCHVCADTRELSRELRLGAGAALMTEEVHASHDVFYLVEMIRAQPAWSDVPMLLLSATGADSSIATWAMQMLGNVTILERPIRVTTLVSALQTAIRARRRQYQLRDQIEALQKSEERLRLAIEFGKLGLWEWDIETDELRPLHHARDLPLAKSTTAQTIAELVHPDDRELIWAALQAALRGEGLYDCEFRVITPDGNVRWLSGKGELLRDEVGNPVGMLGVNYDITERKNSEDALKEADHRKDKFLATLAHELRNPLAPIRNALQVMHLAGTDAAIVEQSRRMMERQVGQMVRLIDDLLDVSRISTGKLTLRKERIELVTVINNAVDTARPVIEAAGHQLSIDLPVHPVYLEADAMRLAQVFSNLLNNSAKYTNRGGHIWLSAVCRDDELIVTIKDNGIGIPPEALSSVFEMFTQLDPSRSQAQGGLGIGLMLVKQLLGMHGGSISAHSEGIGKGAEFTLRMPTMATTTTSQKENMEEDKLGVSTGGCRILIADDNADAADSMGMMLRIMGNDVRIVYNGLEAIEEAAKFHPDVALLDIGMPQLNGYETARRLREYPWSKNLILIALTGWGQEDDKRKAAEAGFHQHFTKPVNPTELIKLISGLADTPPRKHGAGRGEAHATAK